jgi:rRNA maturation endonuclease Nob1
MSEYLTYPNGALYLNKIKSDPNDLYRCIGCGKTWPQTAKKMGHKEASCKRYR